MTARMSGDMSGGRAGDLARLVEDDLLLDQLGRGDQPTEPDDLALTLSEWRAALPEDAPADDALAAAAVSAVRRSQRSTRWLRRSAVVATAGVLTFGGLSAAAQSAGPTSPLWPVTTLLYPELAESRAADAAGRAVSEARAAIDDGRAESASRLLGQASSLVDQVDDPAARDRLRREIDVLRARLAPPPDAPVAGDAGPGAPTSLPEAPRPAPPPPSAAEPTLHEPPGTSGPAVPTSAAPPPGDATLLPPVPVSPVPEQVNPTAQVPDVGAPLGR